MPIVLIMTSALLALSLILGTSMQKTSESGGKEGLGFVLNQDAFYATEMTALQLNEKNKSSTSATPPDPADGFLLPPGPPPMSGMSVSTGGIGPAGVGSCSWALQSPGALPLPPSTSNPIPVALNIVGGGTQTGGSGPTDLPANAKLSSTSNAYSAVAGQTANFDLDTCNNNVSPPACPGINLNGVLANKAEIPRIRSRWIASDNITTSLTPINDASSPFNGGARLCGHETIGDKEWKTCFESVSAPAALTGPTNNCGTCQYMRHTFKPGNLTQRKFFSAACQANAVNIAYKIACGGGFSTPVTLGYVNYNTAQTNPSGYATDFAVGETWRMEAWGGASAAPATPSSTQCQNFLSSGTMSFGTGMSLLASTTITGTAETASGAKALRWTIVATGVRQVRMFHVPNATFSYPCNVSVLVTSSTSSHNVCRNGL